MSRVVHLSAVVLAGAVAGGGLAACSALPGTPWAADDACVETVAEGGVVDGIDLPVPDWLPTGFPLPERISLRHLSEDPLGDADFLTGVIPGGDAELVVARLVDDLAGAEYEVLLVADGFVSRSNPAVVALSERLARLVTVHTAEEVLPVRVGDDRCPWMPALLLTLKLDPADPPATRALYARSSLTQGTSRVLIGGREYQASGECFVHDDTYAFGPTDGHDIGVHFAVGATGTVGFASVDVVEEAAFGLDVTPLSGIEPTFDVTPSGFTVQGMFVDAFGDLGLVDGRIEVTCD